jgi:hypothetical protein
MTANPQDVIALALCDIAGVSCDQAFDMRTQALAIHAALENAGLVVTPTGATPDIAELRALAMKADPGPWTIVAYGDGDSLVIHKNDTDRICFMATHGGSRKSWEAIQANAAYIAALSPDVVLKLLDALEGKQCTRLLEEKTNG